MFGGTFPAVPASYKALVTSAIGQAAADREAGFDALTFRRGGDQVRIELAPGTRGAHARATST